MNEFQKKQICNYLDNFKDEINKAKNSDELQDIINEIYFYTKGLYVGFKVGKK